MIIVRPPVVASTFYNIEPEMLKKQIDRCFNHELGPKEVKKRKFVAAVVPHAGYEFSGPIAAWTYSRIEKANYLIIGPNHYGSGAIFAIMKNGLWKTPLGEIIVKEDFTNKLIENCKLIENDFIPHQHEHSIEVQLPFLQYIFGDDFKIAPICIMNEQADEMFLDSCRMVGKCIADTIKKEKERWIIIASSDLSHYVPQKIAKSIDNYVIKSILKLNEKDFFARINEKSATVCGFGPIAVTMVAAKNLGAKKAELLKYATSGDVTGDAGSVVGYSSIIFH